MEKKDIIDRLANISIFREFKDQPDILELIADILQIESYKADTYVLREGETGNRMYILNRGTVRVEQRTPAEDNFTVVNLTESMHVFFGEIALLDNDVRSASVKAINDIECFVIHKKDFEELCEKYPVIGYRIMKEIARSLTQRIRKSNQEKINLIQALISD
jgi:CRP-like cAMP-binding protein